MTFISPGKWVVPLTQKSHCEISSLSASCNLIDLDVRRALEIALFIFLVNRSAPGTTSENDTHLPTKRWRLLTEAIEHARVCSIRSRNFSFFSGIRWNTCTEASDRKPRCGTILRGIIRMNLGKPRKYPSLIKK